MRVHVLTHSIVETDDSVEIYAAVAEHIENVKAMGVIKSMITVPSHDVSMLSDTSPYLKVDVIDAVAWITVNDEGLCVEDLIKLAIDALYAAVELEKALTKDNHD